METKSIKLQLIDGYAFLKIYKPGENYFFYTFILSFYTSVSLSTWNRNVSKLLNCVSSWVRVPWRALLCRLWQCVALAGCRGDKLPPVWVSQPYGFWCSSMIGPASAGYADLRRKPGINWNPVVFEPSAQSVCLSASAIPAPSIQLLKEKKIKKRQTVQMVFRNGFALFHNKLDASTLFALTELTGRRRRFLCS